MINLDEVRGFVEEWLQGKEIEVITMTLSVDNSLLIELDAYRGVSIDACVELTNALHEKFGEALDDYNLEVGSVSLTAPFKTPMQYRKHVGDDVIVTTKEGKVLRGQLVDADEEEFMVDVEQKVRVEGKKRMQKEIVSLKMAYTDVKQTRYDLKF